VEAQVSDELTRTELRRIAEEFKSERDAAKRDAMRAFDERNIALDRATAAEKDASIYRAALAHIADTPDVQADESAGVARRALERNGK
jgi:hypothetical protein